MIDDIELRAERSNALLYDRAATWAMLFAFNSGLAAVIEWADALSPKGGRGSGLVCLPLLLVLVWWFVSVTTYEERALRHVGLAIVAWPLLACGPAVLAAKAHDVFGLWVFALSLAMAIVAWIFLRRSTLPGGSRTLVPLPPSAERPISPLVDYSKLDPIDPLGNIASPSSRQIAAAQPRWLAASTLVISGSLVDAIACTITANPLPDGLQTTLRGLCAIAVMALAILYVRSFIAFARRPNHATRHQVVVVFDLAVAFFGACAVVDVAILARFPFGPGYGAATPCRGAGCVAIALGTALAVGYARRKVLSLDLVDLAARGYRADAS